MTDISDLSIEDQKEIERFKVWLAKIDVLEKSGRNKNEAMVEAYQEVYYPETIMTAEPEEELSPEEIAVIVAGEEEIRKADEEQYRLSEEARQEDADLWLFVGQDD